jgi:hypothetical protein
MYRAPDHAPLAWQVLAFCAFQVTVTGTPVVTVLGDIASPTVTLVLASAKVLHMAAAMGVSKNKRVAAARHLRVLQDGFVRSSNAASILASCSI